METTDDLFSSEIKIDAAARSQLTAIASWAMVVVAVTVLGYVLNILELIISDESGSAATLSEGFTATVFSGEKDVTGTLITIAIGLVVNYFLFRFAGLMSSSIRGMSRERFSRSFRHLKIYFAITAIFMILCLLLLLILVVAVL